MEDAGAEAKLSRLKELLHQQGFFDEPDQAPADLHRVQGHARLPGEEAREWGFRSASSTAGWQPGSRDEPGTRLYAEQQFREGAIQVLVATEAAGEGINLQCCHILFNYDIPWNPNRLEQRMGRIHRYGQKEDCLIFNFVATNTIEGRVLQRLLEKLQEIRDALDDDAVFNVVGEVLPPPRSRGCSATTTQARIGDADLEDRLLTERGRRPVPGHLPERPRRVGVEEAEPRHAHRAAGRRLRSAGSSPRPSPGSCPKRPNMFRFALKPVPKLPHTFDPPKTPSSAPTLRELSRTGSCHASRAVSPLHHGP